MKGWKSLTLAEVMELEYGKPLAPEDRNPTGLYPAYGANGEKDRTDRFYRDQPSIIVGRKGSAGEITLTEEKYWPLDVTYFAEFDRQRHDLKFLYYLLTTLDLPSLAKGVKPGINRNEVYSIPVMVPPLPEQRRIVAILDDAFEGIDTAQVNAEKNLQNARELADALGEASFDQHTDDRFTASELDTLCELIVDCEHKTAPTQELGYPSIRTPNIGKGKLVLEEVNRVSKETYEAWTRRAIPIPGDLILAREAPAGNVAVVPEGMQVCLGQRTVLIRPRREVFEPEYLAHLLLQRSSRRRLLAHSRGTTVQHVNMKDIRAFMIGAVPSLEMQLRVVENLAEIEQACQSLEVAQRQKLAALDELKRSLLHRAFTGALVVAAADEQVAEVA